MASVVTSPQSSKDSRAGAGRARGHVCRHMPGHTLRARERGGASPRLRTAPATPALCALRRPDPCSWVLARSRLFALLVSALWRLWGSGAACTVLLGIPGADYFPLCTSRLGGDTRNRPEEACLPEIPLRDQAVWRSLVAVLASLPGSQLCNAWR